MNQKLILAVPKGRILQELLPLLKRAEIIPEPKFFDKNDRSLQFETNIDYLDIIRVRSFDVATFVAYGAAQLGVAGSDVLAEFDYPDLYVPLDLDLGHCRLSVAVPEALANAASKSEPPQTHLRIATKYPHLTQQHFSAQGIQAECVKLNGAMELAPSLNLCDHIVDLVSTGNTLKANHLVEVEKILDISSQLIVNRNAYKIDKSRLKPLVDKFEKALS